MNSVKKNIPLWRRALLKALRCEVYYTQFDLTGPTIIECNHVSMLDGIIVALASPYPLTFAVEHQYAIEHPFSSRVLKNLSKLGLGTVIPVCSYQPMGVRTLLKELKQGSSVMIFPEGKISIDGSPNERQPGLKWLSNKSKSKVKTIRLKGAENSRFFSKSGTLIWPKISLFF